MKAYSERWKNEVYEMETGRRDFVGDWVSKDVAIRHRMTTYIHTHNFNYMYKTHFFKLQVCNLMLSFPANLYDVHYPPSNTGKSFKVPWGPTDPILGNAVIHYCYGTSTNKDGAQWPVHSSRD
jgi:hypothetical protein